MKDARRAPTTQPRVRRPAHLLALLLAVDLVLIVLHVPQVVDLTEQVRALPLWSERIVFDRRWWLEMDGGHAEWWGYAKTLVAVALSVFLLRSTRQRVYAAWAATFMVIMLDDALQLHEWGGVLASGGSSVSEAGGSGSDVGELAVWALLGAPLLAALVFTHQRSDVTARLTSRRLARLTTVLLLLAAGVDAVHARLTGTIARVVGTIEDGGELVVLTLIVVVLAVAVRSRAPAARGRRASSPARRSSVPVAST